MAILRTAASSDASYLEPYGEEEISVAIDEALRLKLIIVMMNSGDQSYDLCCSFLTRAGAAMLETLGD